MTVLIPEHRELASPSPDIAAEMFLLRYGGNTAAAYRNDLAVWGRWLAELGISPFEANRNHIQLWIKGMQGRAPATVARRLACLSSFYRYLEDEKLVESNPLAGVRRPKGSGRPVSGLDKHELRSLLRQAKAAGHMEHALCLLLSLNGLRVASCVALNWDDLGQERGYRVVTVKGKGGKVQRLPLADVTWQAVSRIMEPQSSETSAQTADIAVNTGPMDETGETSAEVGQSTRHGAEPAGVSHPLFTSPTGERLDRFQAFRIVRRLAALAGVREVSPHSLRHTYCSLALDGGAAIHDVQASMAHADPKTTMAYATAARGLDRNPTFIVEREVVGHERLV